MACLLDRRGLEGEADWTLRSLYKVKGSLSGRWRSGPLGPVVTLAWKKAEGECRKTSGECRGLKCMIESMREWLRCRGLRSSVAGGGITVDRIEKLLPRAIAQVSVLRG